MLILVGVTVTIAINGGLIGTAKDSKEETRYTQVLAEKEMWEQEERPTERFGIKSETLEDLITRLENEKLLTKKEAEEVRKDGRTTIAKKWLVFGARKNVADASLWEYKLDKKTNLVTITKYLGVMDDLTELTIPNFLLIDGKEYRVTKIEGHDAWQARPDAGCVRAPLARGHGAGPLHLCLGLCRYGDAAGHAVHRPAGDRRGPAFPRDRPRISGRRS